MGDSELIKKKINIGLLLTGNKYIAKNKMKQNTYLPSLIKIYCLQLHETIDSSVYRRLLALCPGIDKNEQKTYVYEPLSEYFISVDDSNINQLHFQLRYEKDKLLELGVASKITVEILDQLKEILNHNNENIYFELKTLVDSNTNTNWDEMASNMYDQDLADENDLLEDDS